MVTQGRMFDIFYIGEKDAQFCKLKEKFFTIKTDCKILVARSHSIPSDKYICEVTSV
tara:strand:+ start:14 stop:184 length:171 start_codon:yes stop_codon:yes gene_type:complete